MTYKLRNFDMNIKTFQQITRIKVNICSPATKDRR